MAERSVFSMSRAMDFFVKWRMESASAAFLPRMSASTSPAFWADVRRYFEVAVTSSIAGLLRLSAAGAAAGRGARPTALRAAARSARDLRDLLDLGRMALEGARGRELAELVADHVLGDVHGDELPPVVDGEGVADHLRRDRRPARPGLHDLALAGRVHGVDLLLEVVVDERPLLLGTHYLPRPF